MIVAIPFHTVDLRLVRELLAWCKLLGGCRSHDCLLVADAGVEWGPCLDLITFSNSIFRSAKLITNDRHIENWPEGPNSLLLTALQQIEKSDQPLLWLEPDAIPLKPNWLDTLSLVYTQCGKPFMGQIYTHEHPEPPMAPYPLMSGVAVYPPDGWSRLAKAIKFAPNLPFDVSCAPITYEAGANTKLIQHYYGEKGLPPTFSVNRTDSSPRNTFTLDRLHPNAVIFHRNKDGSLIRLLRAKHFPNLNKFAVVYPFHSGDMNLALKNLEWMEQLRTPKTHDIILHSDKSVDLKWRNRMVAAAERVFTNVSESFCPANQGPNVSWIAAATYMHEMQRPWFWLEPDATPLKPNWLSVIQARYQGGFLGPVVPDMNHMNGTAVYPANTPLICPKTMATGERFGFDVLMKDEMMHLAHNCIDIFHHAWVERNGQLLPHGAGQVPTFPTLGSLNRISQGAVIFHRCKDGSLIDRLRQRHN